MYLIPRLTTSLVMALAVTLALFYLMKTLIETDEIKIETIPTIIIDLVKPLEMREVIVESQTPTPPPPPAVEPEPPTPVFPGEKITKIHTGPKDPDVPSADITIGGFTDGGYLPLVRVEPTYPRSAITRGIEGYTVVEFDITAQGIVQNPRVLVAFPSNIFNAASLKAISKFKYKPRVDNGVAQPVYGIRNKFVYRLGAI